MADVEAPDGRFTSIASGQTQTCALDEQGEATCWSARGLPTTPPPDGRFTRLAVGQYTACGVREEGTVTCWGGGPGRMPDPATVEDARGVAVGQLTACVVAASGELVCSGESGVEPPEGRFRTVRAAGPRWCALAESDGVRCWQERTGEVHELEGDFTAAVPGQAMFCGLSEGSLVCRDWSGRPMEAPADGAAEGGVVGQEGAREVEGTSVLWTLLALLGLAVVGGAAARARHSRRDRRRPHGPDTTGGPTSG
ncbi:MAG: hypothetical protein ACQEXJ_08605 [Myxococcota bacterium]